MATYTNIQGQNILIVSSDPANPTVGQMWYNTTSNTLKASAEVGAWATGGNLPAYRRLAAGSGTQTSALLAGGGEPQSASSFEYSLIKLSQNALDAE